MGRYTDTTLADLRQQVAEHIAKQTQLVARLVAERVHGRHDHELRAIVEKGVATRSRELSANLDIETQFYVDELKRPATGAGNSVLTFHGPVGAVQTGAFATAHVSLAGPERDLLVEALEGLRRGIEQNTEATADQRTEGNELIADVIKAVKTDRPNAPKVAGLLGGLASTVQTVASLQEAWDFVKDAAMAVGIPLP